MVSKNPLPQLVITQCKHFVYLGVSMCQRWGGENVLKAPLKLAFSAPPKKSPGLLTHKPYFESILSEV